MIELNEYFTIILENKCYACSITGTPRKCYMRVDWDNNGFLFDKLGLKCDSVRRNYICQHFGNIYIDDGCCPYFTLESWEIILPYLLIKTGATCSLYPKLNEIQHLSIF